LAATDDVYNGLFETLIDQYDKAVGELRIQPEERRNPTDTRPRLAAHLVTAYWQGKAETGRAKEIFERFLSSAPGDIVASALEYVGRSLRRTRGAIPATILDRLTRLWEDRLAAADRGSDKRIFRRQLAAFGAWFISGKFDDAFALHQLHRSLALGGLDVNAHTIDKEFLRRLTALAASYPDLVIGCLRLVVDGSSADWEFSVWLGEARKILETVLNSGCTPAKTKAVELIHRFGARGFIELYGLLPTT
jgi:hypothetical protein